MQPIREFVGAFAYIRRQQGWREAFGFLILSLVEFRKSYLWRRSLSEPISPPPARASVAVRPATLDDLSWLETIVPRLRVRRFAKKMQAGENLIIAVHDDRVVAFGWICFADSPTAAETALRLGPKDAYMWGAFVAPEYRAKGIITTVAAYMLNWLKDRGFESAYQLTRRDNLASIRNLQRIGSHIVGEIVFLKILGWKMRRYTPTAGAPAVRSPLRV